MTRSRTIRYAAFVAVLGALQSTLPEIQAFMPEWGYGVATILIAVGIAYFRAITDKALSER